MHGKKHNNIYISITRSSHKYAYAVAWIKNQFFQTTDKTLQSINHVIYPNTGTSCGHRKLTSDIVPCQSAQTWETSLANEFGRLTYGVGSRMPICTNTINFIRRNQVPQDRKVTYGNMVCDIRPQKKENYWVRITV